MHEAAGYLNAVQRCSIMRPPPTTDIVRLCCQVTEGTAVATGHQQGASVSRKEVNRSEGKVSLGPTSSDTGDSDWRVQTSVLRSHLPKLLHKSKIQYKHRPCRPLTEMMQPVVRDFGRVAGEQVPENLARTRVHGS